MAISTYSELSTAVTNYTHRAGLTDRIPEFIAMAEAYLNRKLRVKEMEASATITPSTTVRYVALPTGYMELIAFTDDYGDPMEAVDPETLEKLAYGIDANRPKVYRISSRIDFEAIANTTYNFTMRYYKRLDLATDLTNSVLTYHPDVYLYATLTQAALFAKDQNSAQGYMAMRDDAIKAANSQSVRNLQTLKTDLPTRARSNILSGV